MECYKINQYKGSHNIFNVNHTYIITLDNAIDRHKNIYKQLKHLCPTKNVSIVFNKGYKKCDKIYKNKIINKTYIDLFHAYLYIFKLAKENNFDNILILEDDFIWTNNISNNDIKSINNFINNNQYYYYLLGTKPFLMTPFTIFNNHIHIFIKGSTHSGIFSKNGINYILDYCTKCNYKDDIDIITTHIPYKYCYYKPICIQVFDFTNNKKTWQEDLNYLMKNIIKIGEYFDHIFNLDKKNNIEYSFKRYGTFLKIINIIFYILVLLLLVKILKTLFLCLKNKYKPKYIIILWILVISIPIYLSYWYNSRKCIKCV